MTKSNNIQIKDDVSNSKNQGKQAPWGNLFGDILKAICKMCANSTAKKNKASSLFKIFKKLFKGKYKITKLDPLTLICYLTNDINKRNNRITKFIRFLSEYDINIDKKIDFNNETGIPTKNLFEMANKCKYYPFDELWELSLRLYDEKLEVNKFDIIFSKITKERTGVKVTNLSAMMYLCKPNYYYVIDQKGIKKLLKLITVDEKIYSDLVSIRDNKKGSYGLDMFFKLQNLCLKNKNIIGTPYEFYLNSH